jgi:hypothetical protein
MLFFLITCVLSMYGCVYFYVVHETFLDSRSREKDVYKSEMELLLKVK